VVNGVDATLVTRTGYASEMIAREAGHAAAAALSQVRRPMMISNNPPKRSSVRKGGGATVTQGRSLWAALVG
jgi:hypothetical protein